MDFSSCAGDLTVMHDASVLRFTKVPKDSGYVGESFDWKAAETLNCGKYPATDKQSIELYGPRTQQMFRLHFDLGTVINDGEGVSFDTAATEPSYTVVSAIPRKTHVLAVVEVMEVGNTG